MLKNIFVFLVLWCFAGTLAAAPLAMSSDADGWAPLGIQNPHSDTEGRLAQQVRHSFPVAELGDLKPHPVAARLVDGWRIAPKIGSISIATHMTGVADPDLADPVDVLLAPPATQGIHKFLATNSQLIQKPIQCFNRISHKIFIDGSLDDLLVKHQS